jgi:hypothetical protein
MMGIAVCHHHKLAGWLGAESCKRNASASAELLTVGESLLVAHLLKRAGACC